MHHSLSRLESALCGIANTFHVSSKDPIIEYFKENEPDLLSRLLITPGDPTTEIRSACYYAKLSSFLKTKEEDLICVGLQIQETPTNAVRFNCADITKFLPSGTDHWWNRSDLSINNL